MENFIALAVPVLLLLLLFRIITKPIRVVFKLLLNTLLGFACLFLLNFISGYTGVVFEINFITAAIAGVLGIPGILLLMVLKYLL